jgi:hypothetical protein
MVPSQSKVCFSNFGGNLDFSRILNPVTWHTLSGRPSWVFLVQNNVALSQFSGTLLASRITDISVLLSWASSSQSNVTLSNFGGDLRSSKVTGLSLDNIPGFIDSSRVNNFLLVPTWVNYETQSQVQLSGFGGNIPYTRISGLPEQEYIADFL